MMLPTWKLRIGISSCLLGQRVRWDGGHKQDDQLVNGLARQGEWIVEWIAVCPEVELGMGVPREPVRLVRGSDADGETRMLGCESGHDWTKRMADYCANRVERLSDLDGYILKSRSPSCGLEKVKLFSADAPEAIFADKGVGLFAAALRERWPDMPVEEEGRLQDAGEQQAFIARVLAYGRRRRALSSVPH